MIVLVARVRYHSRAYLSWPERDEAHRRLAKGRRRPAEEVARRPRYVQSLLPERLKGDVSVGWRFMPSTRLGGDVFVHRWLGRDHLAVYLLDVSGHGVGSSPLAVSAANRLSA